MNLIIATLIAQTLDPIRIVVVAIFMLLIRLIFSPSRWLVPTLLMIPCVSALLVTALEMIKPTQSSLPEMSFRFFIGLISSGIIVLFFRIITRPFRY
jgi:hypothetical protein